MIVRIVLSGFLILGWAAGVVLAQKPLSPPSYNSSRYLENYEYLKDPARHTDFWDPIKFMPLDEDGEFYFSLGGETRQHFEYIRNENWGKGLQDDNGWYLQRYLLHADFHARDRFRLFSQIQTGTESGRAAGPRGVDEDRMDVHQLFGDLRLTSANFTPVTLRIGRQEIIFGSRRFLNYRERPNLRLSHDAVELVWKPPNWTVTGFTARPVDISRDFFDNNSGWEHTLWGLYGVHATGWKFPAQVDLYYIGLNRENAVFVQGRAHELRHTIGTRLWGKQGAWDYNFEWVYQFGSFGDGNISAWATASDTGYTWHFASQRKLRFSVRADVYSGDDNPNDGDLNSFNPFFPKGKHISQLAASGLVNQQDLHPRIDFQWDDHWSMTASALFIWRHRLGDGIYSIANAPLRTGSQSRSRYVGTQNELQVKYQVDRHLDIKGIYIYFEAGPFLQETPPGSNITYLGTMLTYRF